MGCSSGGWRWCSGRGTCSTSPPRIRVLCGGESSAEARGRGNLIASVTATLYYLLLCRVWAVCYAVEQRYPWMAIAIALAAARIVLCLPPQNRWAEGAELGWALLRNIPFLALGAVVIGLFLIGNRYDPVTPLRRLPLAVGLSFGFYLPAALFARRVPALGALMMPKTICYLWIQGMGLGVVLRG